MISKSSANTLLKTFLKDFDACMIIYNNNDSSNYVIGFERGKTLPYHTKIIEASVMNNLLKNDGIKFALSINHGDAIKNRLKKVLLNKSPANVKQVYLLTRKIYTEVVEFLHMGANVSLNNIKQMGNEVASLIDTSALEKFYDMNNYDYRSFLYRLYTVDNYAYYGSFAVIMSNRFSSAKISDLDCEIIASNIDVNPDEESFDDIVKNLKNYL